MLTSALNRTIAMSRAILVTGATGKQGGATIKHLLAANADFTILAVTRNTTSASAQKLASKSPKIKLVQGNMNDAPGIFIAAKKALNDGDIWGVYSVQIPMGDGQNPETEETQGKAMIDAALANNAKHFVYASVERGGPEKSWSNPTNIPHFIGKHRIEQHLLKRVEETGSPMTWTILRPVAFFDNMVPGFFGQAFSAMWRTVGNKRVQFIGSSDVGFFGSRAFIDSSSPTYKNQALSLAGDNLSYPEAKEVFQKTMGFKQPDTVGLVAYGIFWASKEMGTMFKFFKTDGFGADIKELRKLHPALMDYGMWLKEESEFTPKA